MHHIAVCLTALLIQFIVGSAADTEECWIGFTKVNASWNVPPKIKGECLGVVIKEETLDYCRVKAPGEPVVSRNQSLSSVDDCELTVSGPEEGFVVSHTGGCRTCRTIVGEVTVTSSPATVISTSEPIINSLKAQLSRSADASNVPQESDLSSVLMLGSDVKSGCLLKYICYGLKPETITYWFLYYDFISDVRFTRPPHCSVSTDSFDADGSISFIKRTRITCKLQSDETSKVTMISDFGDTSLTFTGSIDFTCSHEALSVWQILPVEDASLSHDLNYLVCQNGTIESTDALVLRGHDSCGILVLSKTLEACQVTSKSTSENQCSIDSQDTSFGKHKLRISNDPAGPVSIHTDIDSVTVPCAKSCEIQVDAFIYIAITCTNGDQVFRQYVNEVAINCPLISYTFTDKVAAKICRATRHPALVIAFVVWVFSGYLICKILIFFIWILFKLTLSLTTRVGKLLTPTTDVCLDCECAVEYTTLDILHETCCNGICPFCRMLFGTELKTHAPNCKSKLERLNEARAASGLYKKSNIVKRRMSKVLSSGSLPLAAYVLVAFGLILPVAAADRLKRHASSQNIIDSYLKGHSLSETLVQLEDLFSEVGKELADCDPGCWHTGSKCVCEDAASRHKPGRKLLMVDDSHRGSLPVENPKGFLNVNSTIMPTEDDQTIQLTFQSSTRTGETVLVSGNSILDISPRENAGLTYTVSSPAAVEKKTVSVVIHSLNQIYKAKFDRWIANRKIHLGTEVECTKDCKVSCTCKDSSCLSKKWKDDRSWSCNPKWCWAIKEGCTCCSVQATFDPSSGFYSVWEMSYVETKFILCLNSDMHSYSCKEISGGGSFSVGRFEISISKPLGLFSQLPRWVAVKHSADTSHPSLGHTSEIILNPDFCGVRHCTHGELGDFSFVSIDALSLKGKLDGKAPIMSWKGVGLDRDCTFAEGPKCSSSGVVNNLRASFENFDKVSEKLTKKFKVNTAMVSLGENNNPQLDLKVYPLEHVGVSQILLRIKGLELKASKVTVEVSKFELLKCGGCRNCYQGFWCTIKAGLIKPNSYYVHLKSKIESTVVDSRSVRLTDQIEILNVTLFSPISETEVSICIIDPETCSQLGNISLQEPVSLLVEQGKQIVSTGNSTGQLQLGWGSRVLNGFLGFFKGVWSCFMWFFTGKWKLILLIIAVIALLIAVSVKFRRQITGVVTLGLIKSKKSYRKLQEQTTTRKKK